MAIDEGLISLSPEIQALKIRLSRMAAYLEKVEMRAFRDEDLSLKPGEVLKEEFKMLRQAHMEGLEFIRKYQAQMKDVDPPDVDASVTELAMRLKALPKDQLEMIRERLVS